MKHIVLATANARYSHTSLALRWLRANMGSLADRSLIMEFTIDERPQDIAEKILSANPVIVGLGIYIWNVSLLGDVVQILKRVRPELTIVLGGPEVSFETDGQEIANRADYTITGDGEKTFAKLCNSLIAGRPPAERILDGALPDLTSLVMPYNLYSDEDLAHRVIYVEASRGCPFGCEFCLASLDSKVRRFPETPLLGALETLWNRGARRFKFVDRALHLGGTPRLMEFFLERADQGLFVHFELVPDRLPADLLLALQRFPPGAVQLEAGLQTANPDVAARIGRKQDVEKALVTIQRLRTETGVHIHSDLVVGLPGESLASLADGFDRLIAARPHEIQVGILKRLRGAPISRHNDEWGMRYNPRPPYDILENNLIDFATMQRLKRFSRYFDLIYNSGNFVSFAPLIWHGRSPFIAFLNLSDWLFEKTGRTHAIALNRLAELLFNYVADVLGANKNKTADCLSNDYARLGRRGLPESVRTHVASDVPRFNEDKQESLPPRQRRHSAKESR